MLTNAKSEKTLQIAIDGPSGAGKSTVAKLVAAKLGILYLDTGAMYRAAALFMLRNGVAVSNEAAVAALLPKVQIHFTPEGQTLLNGENVSEAIRAHEMSAAASEISRLPAVRAFLVARQQQIAGENPCVLDGRDIGLHVLPNAPFKFFLTASPEVRARRRLNELLKKGAQADYKTILQDITERDYNDSHRAHSPLQIPPDADVLDSSELTAGEVAQKILTKVRGC